MTKRLIDADTTDRADGKILEWDATGSTHIYVAKPAAGTFSGKILRAIPTGFDRLTDDGNSSTAGLGRACPIIIPGAMQVRSLWISVATAGTGAIQWGLFDYSSDATACTKVAGGSAAPSGTGWREIAATSAPVSINPGSYMLIALDPATNASTIDVVVQDSINLPGISASFTSYTWDDTPDLTSASWNASDRFWRCFLSGDLNSSSTEWLGI